MVKLRVMFLILLMMCSNSVHCMGHRTNTFGRVTNAFSSAVQKVYQVGSRVKNTTLGGRKKEYQLLENSSLSKSNSTSSNLEKLSGLENSSLSKSKSSSKGEKPRVYEDPATLNTRKDHPYEYDKVDPIYAEIPDGFHAQSIKPKRPLPEIPIETKIPIKTERLSSQDFSALRSSSRLTRRNSVS